MQPPSDFPEAISHVRLGQIKRQVLDACAAQLKLAVSEQITGRFQIIVRPVLALVIRHAVLSEGRAAGEVKRQRHESLLWLLLYGLVGRGIVSAWVMHSALCIPVWR